MEPEKHPSGGKKISWRRTRPVVVLWWCSAVDSDERRMEECCVCHRQDKNKNNNAVMICKGRSQPSLHPPGCRSFQPGLAHSIASPSLSDCWWWAFSFVCSIHCCCWHCRREVYNHLASWLHVCYAVGRTNKDHSTRADYQLLFWASMGVSYPGRTGQSLSVHNNHHRRRRAMTGISKARR